MRLRLQVEQRLAQIILSLLVDHGLANCFRTSLRVPSGSRDRKSIFSAHLPVTIVLVRNKLQSGSTLTIWSTLFRIWKVGDSRLRSTPTVLNSIPTLAIVSSRKLD